MVVWWVWWVVSVGVVCWWGVWGLVKLVLRWVGFVLVERLAPRQIMLGNFMLANGGDWVMVQLGFRRRRRQLVMFFVVVHCCFWQLVDVCLL